jgi:hypothetical protein
MISWRENLITARTLIESHGGITSGPGFSRNYEKARRIVLDGDLSVISGPKVLSFYHVLLDHTCPEVVVDTHMLAAYSGIGSYTIDFRRLVKNTIKVSEAVKALASEKNWLISRMQATIWITWKRVTKGYGEQLSLWPKERAGDLPSMWKGISLLS